MIVAGVWTGVGFSILKNSRTWIRIQKFWNRSGVGVWKSDSGHLCCSLVSQSSLEVPHQDHSIGSTLLLLVHATYIWVLFFAHTRSWWIAHSTQRQPKVATPLWALSCLYIESCVLQAWHIAQLKCFSESIALKSKLNFCHTITSPRWGLWWA